MLRMPLFRSALTLLFLLPSIAAAQQKASKKPKSDPGPAQVMEILRKADAATKAVHSVSYKAEYYGEGDLKVRLSHVSGSVKAKEPRRSLLGRITGSTTKEMYYIEATERRPGAEKETPIKVACDGEKVYRVDENEKAYTTGAMPQAQQIMYPADRLLMIEFVHPTPFNDEIESKSVEYKGKKEIGGVECHVIYVVYQNNSESRWFFGTEDYLPRRVDRIVKQSGLDGATVLTITDLNTKPDFAAGDFQIAKPDGYKRKAYEAPAYPESKPLLPVGSQAPLWELSTPDDKSVSLKSLHGNVVVMDFWATWCGPCKAAMPGIQKLHEKYKGKPVKVFGINCWESGDPAKYMREKEYTYGLLLKADKVAEEYRVSGIPTFYVLGEDGRVLYASTGYSEGSEKKITQIIDQALEESGKGKAKDQDEPAKKDSDDNEEEE